VLALALAAACDEAGQAATRSLPALPPVAALSSPAPGAPAAPGQAAAAATAVVRRYYAALNRLRRQMAAGPVADLLTAECSCRAQITAIRAAIRRGERYTDRIRVTHLVAYLDRPDLVDVAVSLDVRAGGLVDSGGRRLRAPTTLHNLHREILLRLTGGRWLIDEVLAV
jgi:hypothetical protein